MSDLDYIAEGLRGLAVEIARMGMLLGEMMEG